MPPSARTSRPSTVWATKSFPARWYEIYESLLTWIDQRTLRSMYGWLMSFNKEEIRLFGLSGPVDDGKQGRQHVRPARMRSRTTPTVLTTSVKTLRSDSSRREGEALCGAHAGTRFQRSFPQFSKMKIVGGGYSGKIT